MELTTSRRKTSLSVITFASPAATRALARGGSSFSLGLKRMFSLPHSPDELLQRLFTIFPAFRETYEGPLYNERLDYDSVLTAFTSDFGVQFRESTAAQLAEFGALLDQAVAAGGELGRAFSTCFLQHIREVDVDRVFWPYLSSAVREHIKP